MHLFSFAVKSKLIQSNFMQKHKNSSCVSTYLIIEEVNIPNMGIVPIFIDIQLNVI